MKYYSQYGQDEFIDKELFHHKEGGIFVDIGAYDGKRLSNTYFFEKYRGWQGVCFEPNPRIFKYLAENRNCHCINGAVSNLEGDLDFLDLEGVEALGGLMAKYDDRQLKRISIDFKRYNGISQNIIKVPSFNINKVLMELNISVIDYCSIDTEGGELDIVKSIDLEKFKIKVFSIENNFPIVNPLKKFCKDFLNQTAEGYLRKKGYSKVKTIECDEIFCLM